MKKIFISVCTLLSFCFFTTCFAKHDSATLVLDALNQYELPKNFRDTSQLSRLPTDINTKGLNTLNIIGSAQFSQGELETVKQKIKAPILIFDLRQESHGFIDGTAISWYAKHDWINYGKTDDQAAADESNRLSAIGALSSVTVYKTLSKNSNGVITRKEPMTFPVTQVFDEATLAYREKLGYERLYVTDHLAPKPKEVDDFVMHTRYLPENTWLYFHCRAGNGRTTPFMAMDDMMHNAKQVSFNDIIKRQYVLGGINLLELPATNDYRYSGEVKRIAFLKQFYQYCLENHDGFKTKWSKWLNKVKK